VYFPFEISLEFGKELKMVVNKAALKRGREREGTCR